MTSQPTSPRARGATSPRARGATPPGDKRQNPQQGTPATGGKLVAPLTPGRATPGYRSPEPDQGPDLDDPRPRVWVDQDLCTGDGFCAKIAPEQFRMHWDGLAYVVGPDGELRTGAAQTVPVIPDLVRSVIAAAVKCPGDCIYVLPGADGSVYGQASPRERPSGGRPEERSWLAREGPQARGGGRMQDETEAGGTNHGERPDPLADG